MDLKGLDAIPAVIDGPMLAHGSVAAPEPARMLPAHPAPPRQTTDSGRPAWWWLGCHGGAGVSVLSCLVPGGADSGRAWPGPADGVTGSVVLVCRSNAAGLAAAGAAAQQWVSGHAPPSTVVRGVVIMADAPGKLPRPLAARVQALGGVVPRTWMVPWVPAWRLNPPDPASAPPVIKKLRMYLQADLDRGPWEGKG